MLPECDDDALVDWHAQLIEHNPKQGTRLSGDGQVYMIKWIKSIMIFGGILIGAPLVLIVLALFLLPDLCGNEIYSEHVSPDNDYKAVIFQRDCGSTTGFSTQLSIIDANSDLDNDVAGNVLILDGHPDDIQLKVAWRSNNELVVNHLVNGHEHRAKTEFGWFNKISIVYNPHGS